jgi:hypothetical protein
MNPIAAIKLIPKVRGLVRAVEAFRAHPGPDEVVALEQALLPLIEGFVGRDVVDDVAMQTATLQVYEAVAAVLLVARDVQAKQATTC